ncbi:hypothetical protein PQ455_13670 [Sphingomonas naphthae]|uniref:Uncharacterized protein n=1 Tax=Sphingomonas naphthae TaxID=1813468 RepID=A0ABY7TI98_9SPHN|nr:hypothetical protein [Sphingomonas naphthae]WCT72675.1 hypothetical protein PQ455_13670 [Sphingomonas naphthae]
MTEAIWGDAASPGIDWRISAALENVPRGDGDVAEVTSLEGAVRAWLTLDAGHRADAILTVEHPVILDGVSMTGFSGEGISALAERLPGPALRPIDGTVVDDAD